MPDRRQSDWGLGDVRGGDAAPGSSPSGASEAIHGVLQTFVRLPGFGKLLTLGRIGDVSQGVSGGIDANRINRSMLGPLGSATAYAITATVLTEVDTMNLAGTMYCTGRPVWVWFDIGNTGRGTGQITVDVAMDGTRMIVNVHLQAFQSMHAGCVIRPAAGTHRFALRALVDAGTGNIYGPTAMGAWEL